MAILNNQEAEFLSQIYNTLFKVRTYGDDTIMMGRALEAFKDFISNIEIVQEEQDNKQEG